MATHAYFTREHQHALVPLPNTNDNSAPEPQLPSVAADGTPAIPQRKGPVPPILAPDDSRPQNRARKRALEPEQWVAPDYVIKPDDDSFVMLAELEGRLRVEWADALADSMVKHGKVMDPRLTDQFRLWKRYDLIERLVGSVNYASK
ncbi:hypothetical protein FRC04_004118 [Tulasnella sp. 424]|nr:hypothetical protein FRC04_004118 [Tulasnella sp. 424]